MKEAKAFDTDDAWTWEALLVIDRTVAPIGGGASEGFTSGSVDGRVYLHDYRRNAVICAGHVHADYAAKTKLSLAFSEIHVQHGRRVVRAGMNQREGRSSS